MSIHKLLPSETILPDNAPVHLDYVYIADNVFVRCPLWDATVIEWKDREVLLRFVAVTCLAMVTPGWETELKMTTNQMLKMAKAAKLNREKTSDYQLTSVDVENRLVFDRAAERLILVLVLKHHRRKLNLLLN